MRVVCNSYYRILARQSGDSLAKERERESEMGKERVTPLIKKTLSRKINEMPSDSIKSLFSHFYRALLSIVIYIVLKSYGITCWDILKIRA